MSDSFNFKVFQSLVESFSLDAPLDSPEWESVQIATFLEEIRDPASTKTNKHPDVRLWYNHTIVPGLGALERKLGEWLGSLGIVATDRVVKITVGTLTLAFEKTQNLCVTLELLKSCVRNADVSHFAILNTNLPASWASSLEWDGFILGPLDVTKVQNRCKRAGEPLMKENAAILYRKPAIASPIYQRPVFDLNEFFSLCEIEPRAKHSERLQQEWFRAIQEEHWNQMWADFENRRALLYAIGYGLVEGNTFRDNLKLIQISCYLKLRRHPSNEGQVVFGLPKQYITLPDLSETRDAISLIDSLCPFRTIKESSLNQIINAYATTLCRGTTIALEGHVNEAYLHLIIALEQLFSSKENTSQTVAGRTSVLVHRQLGIKFSDCRKSLLKEHYEARSRFVHGADPIPHKLIEPIHRITQAVLKSLLWLAKGEEARSPDFFDTWVKRLDWIIAGYEAGIQTPDDVLDANGIITSDALPLP